LGSTFFAGGAGSGFIPAFFSFSSLSFSFFASSSFFFASASAS